MWCANALNTTSLTSALMMIGGFALLAVGGGVFIARDDGDASTTYLGLIGHIFLFAIAIQSDLAFPPWPLFTALFVLDLGIGIAAIYLRRAKLMTAAMASPSPSRCTG